MLADDVFMLIFGLASHSYFSKIQVNSEIPYPSLILILAFKATLRDCAGDYVVISFVTGGLKQCTCISILRM